MTWVKIPIALAGLASAVLVLITFITSEGLFKPEVLEAMKLELLTVILLVGTSIWGELVDIRKKLDTLTSSTKPEKE